MFGITMRATVIHRRAWLGMLWCAGVGAASGHAQPVLQMTETPAGGIEIRWTNQPPGLRLEATGSLQAPVVWQPASEIPVDQGLLRLVTVTPSGAARFYRLRQPDRTTVIDASPAPGEASVSVTRETLVRFSHPLAADTPLAGDRFSAEFAGRKLLSRVEVSADRRQATLLYLEPLPGARRVQVTLATDGLLDQDGQPVDGDGDGLPGGTRRWSFDTMSLTAVPGTAVTGQVFASDPVPAGAGVTNRPLAGVVITVDGAEDRMRATTDETGHFHLSPCPAGKFFVHIDGRPAWESNWPEGDYYPYVGKTFEAVPGRSNNLAGGTGEIYLPLVKAGTLQPVSPAAFTPITFPAAVLAEHPELAGVMVTVPPNALYADDGTRGGRIGLAPVAPDRIPSPLPPGLQLPLVITIQTDGPSNFDQPVPVRFPNLPDPVTGQVLPPGAKSALWSYNHDTGRWESQGSMTVSADGRFLDTDPGVGVRQPGWHGGAPGSPGSGPGGGGGGCEAEQQALEAALFGCAFGIGLGLLEVAPAIGCGISIAQSVNGAVQGCSDPNGNCAGSIAYNAFFGAAGCIPGPVGGTIGTFAGAMQCGIELGDATANLALCQEANSVLARASRSLARPTSPRRAGDDVADLQHQLSEAAGATITAILGDAIWMEASSSDPEHMVPFANALVAALDPGSEAGARLSPAERSTLLALPPPAGLSTETRTALLDRFDRFALGGMRGDEEEGIVRATTALHEHSTTAERLGWATMFDGLVQTWSAEVESFDAEAGGAPGGREGLALQAQGPGLHAGPGSPRVEPRRERELLWRLVDQTDGLTRFGRTEPSGSIAQIIMGVERPYILTYLDPLTLDVGSVFFRSAAPGTAFRIPYARFAAVAGPDSDGDGLNDLAEGIAGTNPQLADTDADGTPDLVELQQGQNPLDGIAMSQGVVAGVTLGGSAAGARALGLHVEGPLLFVANGRRGLAILDVTDPLQPMWMSELDLPGESTDVAYEPASGVVALIGSPEAFVAGERGLLHLVDASDPLAPRLRQTYSLPAVAVDAWNGRVFVALGNFAAKQVRIYDPGSTLQLAEFTTQDYPTGLRVVGGRAYVATRSAVEIFDVTPPQPVRLGQLAGDFTAEQLGRTHLALDGTTLFVGKTGGAATVDVSNPADPVFLGQAPAGAGAIRSFALSGGGRMAALTLGTPAGNSQAAASLSIFNVSDPADLGRFELGLSPQFRGRDVVMVGGYAIVADDNAGISVLNFAALDVGRQAPAIAFDPAFLDRDPATPGIQVPEGDTLELAPRVQDDVHLSVVELLVDGRSVEIQRTYPVGFRHILPTVPPEGFNTNLVFQFRATDRSGNAAVSAPVTVELVSDRQPPGLRSSFPASLGAAFIGQPFVLEFNEAVEAHPVDVTRLRLLALGSDAAPGGGDDAEVSLVSTTTRGALVNLGFPDPLPAGRYQLTLSPGLVRDRAGNALAESHALTFDLHAAHPGTAVWISDVDGQFDEPGRWLYGRVPAQDDPVLIQRFGARPLVTLDSSVTLKSLELRTPFTAVDRSSLTVLGDLLATEPVTVPGGLLLLNGNSRFQQSLTLTGGRAEVSGRLEVQGVLTLNRGAGLTLDGPSAQFLPAGGFAAANFSLLVRDGAQIDLAGLVAYDDPGDFSPLFPLGTSFRAQGAGSRLTLPDLTTVSGAVDWNVRGAPSVVLEAVSGGELQLPKLTHLTGRTRLAATGLGSGLHAPELVSVTGPDSAFLSAIEVAGGTLTAQKLAHVAWCILTLDDEGLLRGTTLELAPDATVRGTGTVQADLIAGGKLLLDRVPGSLIVDGNLTLLTTSVLDTTLGLGNPRTEAGRVEVRGATTLAGTLKVTKASGYTPAVGQQFAVGVFATAPAGGFATLDDAGLGATVKAEPTVSGQALSIQLAPR